MCGTILGSDTTGTLLMAALQNAVERVVRARLLLNQLDVILAKPASSLDLVSPYFVPTKAGTDLFVGMASRGVDVGILTNALEATDVIPVHAGYAKRRKGDPRSMYLNTELGFVIDSPALAREIKTTLGKGEEPAWIDREPNSGWLKRAAVSMLGPLPIEWLL